MTIRDNPSDPVNRFIDLQKQGFMKRKPDPKKKKAERPIVACSDCLNWHREGAHSANAETRKANRKARQSSSVAKREFIGPEFKQSYYTVSVRGGVGCAVLSSVALVPEQARCYLESRPGAVVDVEYSEHCAHCRGAGTVAKRGRVLFARKLCPVCKGEPERCAPMRVASYAGDEWRDQA